MLKALQTLSWRSRLVCLLDVCIAAYALALVTIAATGGLDLGWLTINQAAKPVLVLALLLPVRLALGTPGLVEHIPAGGLWQRLLDLVRRLPASAAVKDATFAFLVTRLVSLLVSFLANLLFPPRRLRPFGLPFRRQRFAEIFAVWDSGWYFDIAQRGYWFAEDRQSSIAFFPLYPLLMRVVAWPFGSTDRAVWVAGILISMASFYAALIILHRLSFICFGSRSAARRTVLYIAVFPFSFYFSRVYTESLFLLLTVSAVAAAHRGRWGAAGMSAALATVTRPNGFLIAIPLLTFALRGIPSVRALSWRLAAVGLVPLGLGVFCVYNAQLTGDPFAWLHAQQRWSYALGRPPWEQLLRVMAKVERYGCYDYFFTSRTAAFDLLHATVGMLFLGLTPLVFRRLGAPYGTYMLASLLLPLSSNAVVGIGRYASVLFPIFMVLGSLQSRALHECILIVSALFLALLASLFVTLHPLF